MKRVLKYIIFIMMALSSFADEFQDYKLFTAGKNAYYAENFKEAKQDFELLLRTFPNSNIFERNYAYFYIGMTYFKLNDYKNAIYYLEKATYSPTDNELNSNYEIEKMIYFSQKDYALGYSLLKMGNIEKSFIYLNRVNYTLYFPMSAYYEKKALELLSEHQFIAKAKLQLKFYYDFSQIPNLTLKELKEIGEFFVSEKNYEKAKLFYQTLLLDVDLKGEEVTIYEEYLKLLILNKNYNELIELTATAQPHIKDMVTFYRGVAFYKKRDFSRAIYLFEEINDGPYHDQAKYYLASIYFALRDYRDTIETLKNTKAEDIYSKNMLASSYLQLKDEKNFKKIAQEIVSSYPNTYLGIYYSFILEEKKESSYEISSIRDLSLLRAKVVAKSKNLPEDFLKRANSLEMQQLSEIAKLKDEDILKIILKKRNILEKESLAYSYLTTAILEKGDFYALALKNSQKNMMEFFKYKELFNYLFPRYYSDEINNYAKKYDVPEELIYTIIYNVSGFDAFYASDDSKFGLMGISYNKDTRYKLTDLFTPTYNIEEGTKRLKELLELYNGNKTKVLIAYIYGDDYLKHIYFTNEDFNLAAITVPEERYFLESLLLTYIFYNKLYEY